MEQFRADLAKCQTRGFPLMWCYEAYVGRVQPVELLHFWNRLFYCATDGGWLGDDWGNHFDIVMDHVYGYNWRAEGLLPVDSSILYAFWLAAGQFADALDEYKEEPSPIVIPFSTIRRISRKGAWLVEYPADGIAHREERRPGIHVLMGEVDLR